MKYTLLFMLLSVTILVNFQPPLYVNQAAIELDADVYDFGEVAQTEKGSFIFCEFEVTNRGTAPLIISKCKGICGCTTPICSKTPISPKSSTTIKVRYDSNRVGSFSKNVTIFSNSVHEPEKIVTIKGMIVG